ncbi:hypothetical protein Tco_0832089 [Tanacetum coccineum]
MTDAQTNQDTEDVHVTLTAEPPVFQQQSSSVSSDLVSKYINPSPDTSIDLIINQNVQSHNLVNVPVSVAAVTPSSATTIPQPPLKDAVDVAIQLQSNKLKEEAQAENEEFLKYINLNIKAIIKDQVKAQVSKIMPKVKKYIIESLGAEVLVRSTNQPQTSYAVAASLSEFELKKILIDKMEENKSIERSDTQKNLYNALVESYNSDKDILTLYGDVVTLKRGRDDQDKDEDPFAGSNRGSKRRRSGKEAESSKEPTHKESKSTSSSKGASRSQPKSSGKSAQAKEHGQKVDDLEEQSHQEINTGNDDATPIRETVDDRSPQTWITHLAQAAGTQSLFNDPTYDLMKSTCKSVVQLEYHLEEVFKATNDQLDWHNPEGRPYPHDLTKPLPLILNARDKVPERIWSPERVVYDKHAYWGTYHWVTSLKIMQFFGYNHLEEIIVRRQDDQLYKLREGDSKRLRRQDIEDMLLLLVQGKLTNLNLDERYALNFSDGTLNHVRTALNDIATGIQMEYLPKRKWSKQDKQRARVMINAIDKKLRDRRLM